MNVYGAANYLSIAFFAGLCCVLMVFVGADEKLNDYPENMTIVEGKISQFEPYFDRLLTERKRDYRRSSDPLKDEGIAVVIDYTNARGDKMTLTEEWPLPWVDSFNLGDTVSVIWTKGHNEPRSVVHAERMLKKSLAWAEMRKSAPEDLELATTHAEKINALLEEYKQTYLLADVYEKDYRTGNANWDFADHRKAWEEQNDFPTSPRRKSVDDSNEPTTSVD